MVETVFDFDDLLNNAFQPDFEQNVEKQANDYIELNLVPEENTVLTLLKSEDEALGGSVSYTSLPPIDVFKPPVQQPTNADQRTKKEQTDKDDIRRRRIRESAAKHRQKKLAQLTEMQAEVKRLMESIKQAETEQISLKSELSQSQTELSMMTSHFHFQPMQYQPYDCKQLQVQADYNHGPGQSLIQYLWKRNEFQH